MPPLPTNHQDFTDVITASIVNDIATTVNGLTAAAPIFTVASPTGVATTDTANIQAAMSNNAVIQLQPGTYVISPGTLSIPAGCQLRGWKGTEFAPGSTTLRLADLGGGANGPTLIFPENAAIGASVVGIVFDGNGSTVGTGNYWTSVIEIRGGNDDVAVRGCQFMRTARSAVYAWGYTFAIHRLVVQNCRFTEIGNAGAGNGGAAIMLDGGVHDYLIVGNYAYGRLSSNVLKVKVNTGVNCVAGLVADNILDYRACTVFDATAGALGLELWNGSWNTRVRGNLVYGPDAIPTAGHFWGISLGDARGSVVQGNQVLGGANNQAMEYGLEVGECPSLTLQGNHIANCIFGSNFTNNNPSPSHSIIISSSTYENIYTNAIISDSSPSAFKITGCSFIDCGIAFLFFNSINVSGGDGTVRDGIISGCTFQLKDQTRLHAEGAIFGVYMVGTDSARVARVTVADCNFGPYPGGLSTVGLTAIEVNNPRGAKIHHCNFDGAAAAGVAQADRAINGFCGELDVDHCTALNFGIAFAFTAPPAASPLSRFEFNNVGTLGIVSSANGPNVVMYWSTTDGRLHVRNQAGTDAAVGP